MSEENAPSYAAQSDPSGRSPTLVKGPIRILCDEIGFRFDPRLERTDLLVAFVRELVAEIAERREITTQVVRMGGKPASEGSLSALALAEAMLSVRTHLALIGGAKLLHDACDRLNPDDAYPTDHLIDMLSSCASAIRFGLESPCQSRHAAEASNHVWKHIYGISRFDSISRGWGKDWARAKLQDAIVSLLPAPRGSGPASVAASVAQPIRESKP